jgi:hypothetical protein
LKKKGKCFQNKINKGCKETEKLAHALFEYGTLMISKEIEHLLQCGAAEEIHKKKVISLFAFV